MRILPLTEETLDLEIDLCLRFHPSGFSPQGPEADLGRKMKKELFEEIFEIVRPAGFVAEEDGEPVTLLEIMPREYARRSGYITGFEGEDEETLTIVCLEVAYSKNRKEIMDLMVSHLVKNLELFKPFKRIEVGAFPRDVDFHPVWVYQKNGFEVSEDRGDSLILTIPLSI